MSSSPWRAPPPSQSSQGQSFLPSGHHHPPNAVGNKQDSHGQGSYGNSMPHRPDQSRLPYSPFTCMNQGAVSNEYQNQPSNALPYNRFPPPLPPSASMAPPPPPPPPPRPGSGHGIPPPFQPPSGYPSMPPPPQSNPFGVHGQPPPSPPFPVTPQHQQQSASTVMFNPAIPPPSHPPPLHPPPPHPSHPPPNPPQEEWSHDSSMSGPGQWNHRPVGNNRQPQSMQPNAHSQQANVHGSSKHTQSRLQPYQSFRSKQSERNHQSSFPGNAQVQPGGDGLYNLEQGMSMTSEVEQPEKEESEDQKWVNEWSKSIQKRASVSKGVRRPIVKISEARMVLCRFLQLLNQLKKKKEDASDSLMKETDERKWFLLCKEMEKQVEDLSKLELKISQPEFVEGLKSQIDKRRRKRERHRRHRQLEWEMREEELRKRNERIDASMAEALQAKQEKEQEEVLQKEVDQVLSEVHKKKQDANKTMELFRALRKLRQLRKESAEKRVGYKAPKVLDERFEKKMSSLEEMMNKQKLLYVEEERALQVMLEEEHEETREKARQKKEMTERQKAEKAWKDQLELLFGKPEELELGHPLFMFRQFHQQASHDLHSLTNIRRQWDMYIVPESDPAGSSIPVSWVMPSEPANHIWATSLVDSAGS